MEISFPKQPSYLGLKEPVEIPILGTSTGSFYARSGINYHFYAYFTCEIGEDVTFFPNV